MLGCGTHGVNEINLLPSVATNISTTIDIPEGVTELPMSFRWKVASVDLNFSRQPVVWNDQVLVKLRRVDDLNKEVVLFATSLNDIMRSRPLSPVSSIPPFVQTDWTFDSYRHPVPFGPGQYTFSVIALDTFDSVGDTYLFIDDIQFRER